MYESRLFVFFLFLLMCLSVTCHADMTSWVDENGVRHYSNVAAPADSATIENVQELESQQEKPGNEDEVDNKDRFGVLKMYEEERRKAIKAKKQAETRAYNERVKRVLEASKKKKEQRQAQKCLAAKEKLEELRGIGWRNYYYFQMRYGVMSDSCRIDRHGVIHLDELDAEGERTWKVNYERAVRLHEKKVEDACRY
jgi:hypothetical protein